MTVPLNRRELIQLLAGSALVLQLPAADPDSPLFFTKEEFAILDHLTELVIPADEHSPGAKQAQVAAYIDRTTAESIDPADKSSWRKGLEVVNALSQKLNGAPFMEATPAQQLATLSEMAKNEQDPQTPEQKFFTQLKQTSAFVYYSTSIGIHQEMNYLGNVYLDHFVGYPAT